MFPCAILLSRTLEGGFDMNLIEFLSDKAFSVPLWEIGLLVLINLACLLFGKYRFGLMISCFFMFYWGFVHNKGYFLETLGLYMYVTSCVVMITVFITSIFVNNDR